MLRPLPFEHLALLVEFLGADIRSRHQRQPVLVEGHTKLGQRTLVRLRYRRGLVQFTLVLLAEFEQFGFPLFQRCLERIPLRQDEVGDVHMPFDVVLETPAFRFQSVGMLGQGFVLVAPKLLLIGGGRGPRRQGFKEFGSPKQIFRIVSVGH